MKKDKFYKFLQKLTCVVLRVFCLLVDWLALGLNQSCSDSIKDHIMSEDSSCVYDS